MDPVDVRLKNIIKEGETSPAYNKELNSVASTNLEKLIKLRSLYDEGIISKEEYEEKRTKIMNKI